MRRRGGSRNVLEADGFLSGSLTLKSKREIERLAAGALPTLKVLVRTLTIPSTLGVRGLAKAAIMI